MFIYHSTEGPPDSDHIRQIRCAEAALENEKERTENFFKEYGNDPEIARLLYMASLIENPEKFKMSMQILSVYFDSRLAAKSEDGRPLAFFGQYSGRFGEMLKSLVEMGKAEINKINTNL